MARVPGPGSVGNKIAGAKLSSLWDSLGEGLRDGEGGGDTEHQDWDDEELVKSKKQRQWEVDVEGMDVIDEDIGEDEVDELDEDDHMNVENITKHVKRGKNHQGFKTEKPVKDDFESPELALFAKH
ncbi:hypothetical protein D9757_015481 [Collybiopsis confluens]|uniref:Uncharacterized protein n=1 Tax=Collybiopsis confluens TaxID=2823264 RepID=A0A8H5FGE0_9AGAR|nr:hypothetical protein D9757_015481 [Collybiopsis confluens]